MYGIIIAAIAIAASLLASTMLWGENPSNGRLAVSTLLGIAAATLLWMIVSNSFKIPDDESASAVLAIEMIVLSVVLVRKGRQREATETMRQ